jgi:PDDEXK-like domain of unknown function (DUF3799)
MAMAEQLVVDHPRVHAPGLYFGLSDAEYHDALALSASGIKQLRVSALAWWTNSPLNSDRVDEDTDAKLIGRAYHCRIVEGARIFRDRYAAKLDPADYPSALRTVADIGDEMRRCGLAPRSGERKADLISRLREVNSRIPIWDEIAADHEERHRGKIMLDAALMGRMETAARMIEDHPQLCKAFRDGMPEVSIFWTDETTGVPCKARLDFLKPLAIVDLKTFELREVPPDKAIARAVASYRYHIQASWYLRAADQIAQLVAAGQVVGDHDRDWLRVVCGVPERTFLFVFQAKGMSGVVKGKVLPPGIVLDLAHVACEEALVAWATAWSQWGSDPWLETYDITTFSDAEFPPWIAD